jgi:hypothetical protein
VLAAAGLLAGAWAPEAVARDDPGAALAEAPPAGRPSDAVAARRAAVATAKAGLAVAATALLAWGIRLRRTGRPEAARGLRDAALAALGIGGLLASWNFLNLHYTSPIHAHELFNYGVGSKYFRELGYDRLYECIAVADLEAGLGPRVRGRLITDLATYELRGTQAILADPDRCKRRFAPARWASFTRDVGFFRGLFAEEAWEALQRDHGFNATPAWAVMGGLVASALPESPRSLLALALLDPLLDLASWAAVSLAFGWRAACVALVYWGTNQPAGFEWTGGAFLRHDWIAAMLVGLACLRRGRSATAGALFGVAAALRAFPAVLLLGPALACAADSLRARRLVCGRDARRLAAGALLATVALGIGSAASVGSDAWSRFAANIAHHASVPASNTMGLRTLLSFTRDGRLAAVVASPDAGREWKQRRTAAFAARRVPYLAVAVAYGGLLAVAASRQPPWAAAILGTGAVPFLLDGACYYTIFLAAWGLLWLRSEAVGAGLCALAALEWAIAARFAEPDDLFTAASAAVLAFVALATARLAARARAAP